MSASGDGGGPADDELGLVAYESGGDDAESVLTDAPRDAADADEALARVERAVTQLAEHRRDLSVLETALAAMAEYASLATPETVTHKEYLRIRRHQLQIDLALLGGDAQSEMEAQNMRTHTLVNIHRTVVKNLRRCYTSERAYASRSHKFAASLRTRVASVTASVAERAELVRAGERELLEMSIRNASQSRGRLHQACSDIVEASGTALRELGLPVPDLSDSDDEP